MKLNINYRTLLNIINLNYGVYKPVNTFVSKKDFLSILKTILYPTESFFPYHYSLLSQSSFIIKIKIKN